MGKLSGNKPGGRGGCIGSSSSNIGSGGGWVGTGDNAKCPGKRGVSNTGMVGYKEGGGTG